jgi:hypothetical protein
MWGVHHIINGEKNALGFTILWRSVRIRHPQNHTISGEECARGGVVKRTAFVALDGFDGAAKLCGDISKKIDKVEKVSYLTCKEKVHTKWERSSRTTR